MNSSPYTTLILIALMVVAFYFLIIRPNKKRQQAQQKTMSTLVPGTRVLLGSGIFGTIVSVGDKQAVLELSPGNHLTILKQAITRVVRDGDEDVEADPADEELQPMDDFESDVATDGPTHREIFNSNDQPSTPEATTFPTGSDDDPRSGTNSAQNKD